MREDTPRIDLISICANEVNNFHIELISICANEVIGIISLNANEVVARREKHTETK